MQDLFCWAITCARNLVLSKTQIVDGKKHLLDVFCMAPLVRFFSRSFYCAGICFFELPRPAPSQNNATSFPGLFPVKVGGAGNVGGNSFL